MVRQSVEKSVSRRACTAPRAKNSDNVEQARRLTFALKPSTIFKTLSQNSHSPYFSYPTHNALF